MRSEVWFVGGLKLFRKEKEHETRLLTLGQLGIKDDGRGSDLES